MLEFLFETGTWAVVFASIAVIAFLAAGVKKVFTPPENFPNDRQDFS